MSSENTITIPADLWGVTYRKWSPDTLRNSAEAARGKGLAFTADLLGRLADEIERQAPRPEGWYFIHGGDRASGKFYHWNGKNWAPTESRLYSEPVALPPHATITPVTIGRAES